MHQSLLLRVEEVYLLPEEYKERKKLKKKGLVALAVSLDGNFVQFSLGDNGNLGVEGDAKMKGYILI